MNFLFASVRKDLSRWMQDRAAMLLWFGIPFLIGGLITSMMDSGSGSPTGTLLIADEDGSFISGAIVGAFSQEQLGDLIIVEQVSVEEGSLRINEGEASGFLTIPEGFQDAFLNETPVTLTLKTNPAQTILPGIILMAVLFASNSLATDNWAERDKGTLRRLVSAPAALTGFITGKAVAALAIMGGVTSVVLLAGFVYHGVAWAKFIPSLLWVSLGGVGMFAWFAAIQMLLPNNRAANLVTTILLFPLLMAGGSFFPLAALPEWIADIGRLAPNGFIVDRLSNELVSPTAWSIDARSWLILFAITASGLLASAVRVRTGFARR